LAQTSPPELKYLISRWHQLPEALRASIIALVKAEPPKEQES
jgi:hypothetical protein